MELTVNNISETENVGKILGRILSPGDVLCLDGDLGVGKTTLTKFIAKELQIKEHITSPTFNIIKEYSGRIPLYHMDVYRLESEDDMYDLGYEEYIYSEGASIIEWSKKIENILPKSRINIEITRMDDDKRRLNICGSGNTYDKLMKELECYENSGN